MLTEWTAHLRDPEEKKNFTRSLYNSRTVLERLYKLLDEKEKALDRSENSIRAYDTGNWSYIQSHKNGNREAYGYIKTLINLDQQKEED